MAEVDEIGGTVTDSSPAPPTPVRYRSTNSQFVNHIILDDSDEVDTENYYSDEEEDEESTVVASPNRLVDKTKSTDDKAINMQQTLGSSGKQLNKYPGIGVPTHSLVDLTGQLTDGAIVEVTLRGPTHQDIGSKDLSDVEYFSPGPLNAPPNSPSLKSHTRKVQRVRSVSVD